ncbi:MULTISPECIES: flavodoxin family protein [Streptomyces]|uniref:flavodoxin family protein n=1 Tax=Streptomyces TaxID=1883 RepID=UPI000F765EBF|nr:MULTISPECIES: flavodoxin family protein [Streptomyces]RSS99042.1 flavodoxin [Streptomyces sp. WAC07149]GLX24003.1 flavodoxin [Streptomyces lavendulae subsp. lavendulae]GLX31924.1 flavodoxin [Streptomyces lavendulae subsp. lavendulae]
MKSVIVCASVSHGNTRRVADVMARALGAAVVAPGEADPAELAAADLVGFGSGVYYGRLHRTLTDLVRELPQARGRAFVFATSGLPGLRPAPFTRPLVRRLAEKGFRVDGGFTCRALDTWGPFGLVGGVNRQRPDAGDLAAARAFAERLR